MTILKNKLVAMLLLLTMTIVAVGCGNGSGEQSQAQEPAESQPAVSDTITFVDQAGNTIELPKNVERVVISSIAPLPSIYCLFRGSAEGLIGMSPVSMSAAQNSFLPEVIPEVTEISTDFMKGSEINIEALLALEPDVVFYSANNTEEYEMLTNAGIPAVGFSTSNDGFNTIETLNSWLKQLGIIFGDENKAEGIVEYGNEVYAAISEKIKDIAEEDKPRVLVLFNYGDGVIKTSGSNFFGQFWIEAAGGINVASDLSGSPEISMEQIYEWNPDKIFITNFSQYLPEDLYNNAIEGYDWSHVKAVQEGEVYKFPLGMYRWFPPSSDTPLALEWVAKQIQPELFNDIDMDQEIKDYFQRFYNVELSDEDVQTIYNPAREAAKR